MGMTSRMSGLFRTLDQRPILPPRTRWRADFPEVVIHTTLAIRDHHPGYAAAKAGDPDAALGLSKELLSLSSIEQLRHLVLFRSVAGKHLGAGLARKIHELFRIACGKRDPQAGFR